MLKLKLQHFGHLMQTADSLGRSLMLGKMEDGLKEGIRGETVGWHHQCNGPELGQTLGNCEGQGSLACSSPWSCKESHTNGQLDNRKQDPTCCMAKK